MPQLFTLDRARGLLPQISSQLRDAVDLKNEYQQAERQFSMFVERINLMGGTLVETHDAQALRSRRDTAISKLKDALETIQDFGCLIKDLDKGLIDFPTLYHGREVYLCWQMGEDNIDWWHGVDEGFRGRKPIDAEFIAGHSDDGTNEGQ